MMGEDFSESVGDHFSESGDDNISEWMGGFPRNQHLSFYFAKYCIVIG
jgi:hypothetical protein